MSEPEATKRPSRARARRVMVALSEDEYVLVRLAAWTEPVAPWARDALVRAAITRAVTPPPGGSTSETLRDLRSFAATLKSPTTRAALLSAALERLAPAARPVGARPPQETA